MEFVGNFDLWFLEMIQSELKNPFFDGFFLFITRLGDYGILWIIVSLFLIISKKYRTVGILTISALLLATLLGEGLIKHIFRRIRPFAEHENLATLLSYQKGYSFPSGHAASAFACSTVLMKKFSRIKYVFLTTAFLIAFSRMYFFVHYPSDIAAGALLGIFCGFVVLKFGNIHTASKKGFN